ncbi:sugar ABC transporter substrate-binding protein [Streptomyces europaeiscabiei]|uniref:Extracellular solute-binding protein n=1 Tax=Streptomyces europaeiscabiei TaxID=146819 RepID=A0ABU4NSJ7_9ACTN|nr:extracellular solute-binding protein [Streptomyces europaeiscabiei]MDX2764475.1 extracellular solute-binding protein [Streptomyces europaeiscabiei]MDX3547580.1 extracellular solute-binding protein [Streptomyces europaeiscabiei]MDX3557057.1 extracellular solute-binding protein [Streptomyces europaeiscabiei]MDX3704764.1 extracellular solute-binding protein [Streptomyces europaeiscabiei]MDX3781971.1 extracellular solute-binding protein [Streptomyces europaeiscabiei]
MNTSARRRLTAAVLTVVTVTVGATACSSGSGDTSTKAADGGTYTIWDPYPQFNKGSAWAKLLDGCGTKAGVEIKRTAFDTSDLTNKALLAAQQDNSADVLVVDNPVVSTLAEAGVLTTTDDNKLDTSKVSPNLLAAGQSGGKTYGTPIGANTLALYYNKAVLKDAGVDISSVTDWKSLTAALAKVKKAGKKGITFSAIGTEEGSFQFLPWYWGSGAQLTALDSDQAVSALSLWKNWLDKGYAPNSVINNTQTTSWQEFASGDYAFAENGTWQLANAEKAGFEYGVIPVPGASGGDAAAPTGGEFVTIPAQGDTSRYATSQKLVSCLTNSENLLETDTTLSYVAPTTEVQDKQVTADAKLKPWVDAVKAAKGRTSDDLGTKYPKISEQLWKAVQSALSGSASPKDALGSAQSAVK